MFNQNDNNTVCRWNALFWSEWMNVQKAEHMNEVGMERVETKDFLLRISGDSAIHVVVVPFCGLVSWREDENIESTRKLCGDCHFFNSLFLSHPHALVLNQLKQHLFLLSSLFKTVTMSRHRLTILVRIKHVERDRRRRKENYIVELPWGRITYELNAW